MNKQRGKNVKMHTAINVATDELFAYFSKSNNEYKKIIEGRQRTAKIVPLKINL
jgi:hypothetical protein